MKIIKSFQGLRVIAMLFIFFFHFKIHGEGTFANIYNKFFEDGYFAVTKADHENGYQISYYCNECVTDWKKHKDTCVLTLE